MDPAEILQAIEGCDFFSGFDRRQVESIAAICRMRPYQAGERIFAQGEPGGELFIVAEGTVILERTVNLGARQGTVTVATLGRGKLMGGWSALLNLEHTLMLSAVCQKPAVLVAFRGGELRRLMTVDRKLGFDVLEKLCFLLRERVQLALGAMDNIG
jgi:CRP-like cAMP-binding protein